MAATAPALRNLGDRLFAAGRAFEERLLEGLVAAGYDDVRITHGRVFQHIDRAGTRAVDLAARAGMTKQSMGELIDDLEAKGYVERRPDPTDRRARLVVLTERGREQARAAIRLIAGIEREYRARLGDERYETVLAGLDALAGPAGVTREGR